MKPYTKQMLLDCFFHRKPFTYRELFTGADIVVLSIEAIEHEDGSNSSFNIRCRVQHRIGITTLYVKTID